jgi:transposase-like protein
MQSDRLEKLAVIIWSLGLSYRSIALLLSVFGVVFSRMSAWRDVQQAGEHLRKQVGWKRARIVGVDGAWLNGTGIMVAVDMGDGQPLAIGKIDEKDSTAVYRWLKLLKQRHGIGAIVTDDLRLYRGVSEQLELGHQVCQFHVRRWVGKACWELAKELPEQWLWILDEIKMIVTDLPANGGRQLLELYKQVPGNLSRDRERTAVDRLRHLLICLSESWDRYTTFYHDPGIPWTNNRTEQTIGRMKMRARTVRGYKTTAGMLNGLLVSGSKLF